MSPGGGSVEVRAVRWRPGSDPDSFKLFKTVGAVRELMPVRGYPGLSGVIRGYPGWVRGRSGAVRAQSGVVRGGPGANFFPKHPGPSRETFLIRGSPGSVRGGPGRSGDGPGTIRGRSGRISCRTAPDHQKIRFSSSWVVRGRPGVIRGQSGLGVTVA